MGSDVNRIAANLDRLITVEWKMQNQSQGFMEVAYAAARERAGKPLTLLAAELLQDRVKRGSTVLVITGAGTPPFLPAGETDGPPGAAALARAILVGLGAKTVFVLDDFHAPPVAACCRALGLNVLDDLSLLPSVSMGTGILHFPRGVADPDEHARSLLDEFNPTAVISIERLGPNTKGIRHSSTGTAHGDALTARLESLVMEARNRGIATVAVGDNGNEIGWGALADVVRKHKPYGEECQCPCGGGIANVTEVDVMVPAAVSNWGAYGVAAALALLIGQPDICHDGEMERRSIQAASDAGAPDGATGQFTVTVDGVPLAQNLGMVDGLRAIVSQAFKIRHRDY